MTLEGMFLGWCSCYRVRTFFASCTFLYNYLKELPMFLWQIPWRSSNCFWDISPLGLDLFAWIWKLMNLWGSSSQHYPAVLQTTYWIFKLLWWVHSFLLPTNSGGMMKVGLLYCSTCQVMLEMETSCCHSLFLPLPCCYLSNDWKYLLLLFHFT